MRSSAWLTLFLMLTVAASAAPILQVSQSGTWDAAAPVSTWTAPNATWSFSFLVDSTPSTFNVDTDGFEAPFSAFTYTLGGAAVATTPTAIVWYNASFFGLIDVIFDPTAAFEIKGPQAYSGPESAPTILTGIYPNTIDAAFFNSEFAAELPLTGNLVIAEVPEASTVGMLLIGFGYLTGLKFSRRRTG